MRSLRYYARKQSTRAGSLIMQWMTPKSYFKTLVLVEGWEDAFLYEQVFDPFKSFVRDCGGCDNVVGVNAYVKRYKPAITSISILDGDFRHLMARANDKENLFYTDTHDMETLVMFSPYCFEGVKKVLHSCSPKHNQIIKDLRLLSYMRWYNQYANLKYVDHNLDIVNMKQRELFSYDSLISRFVPSSGSKKQWLKRCFDTFKNKYPRAKSEYLLNGHDYVDRFCYYAKHKDGKQVSKDDVLLAMAIVCDINWFESTRLCQAVRKWEKKHFKTVLLNDFPG